MQNFRMLPILFVIGVASSLWACGGTETSHGEPQKNVSALSRCAGDFCCTPITCADVGANCGTIADGCGGTLDCGTCPQGQTCNGDVCR